MTADRVSVALCTRNGERFIEAQLRSILAQTVPPTEIVLSDDASSDRTLEIARSVLDGTGIALSVLRSETPLGVTANFERAILAASGDLIALCDQDDEWMPDRLERAAALFASRPGLALVHANAALVDADGHPLPGTLFSALGVGASELSAIHSGRAFELFLRRNLVTGATTMIRAELARKSAPFPAGWLHDEWLAIIGTVVGEVDAIESPLISYRQHGQNQVGVRTLSTVGKLRRMVEPGAERNRRLLVRAEALAVRMESLAAASKSQKSAARSKLEHERVRSSLAVSRIHRLPLVLRELRTGRYTRFGRGLPDAVRDLLQPLKSAS